jgi:hypothetical protein
MAAMGLKVDDVKLGIADGFHEKGFGSFRDGRLPRRSGREGKRSVR